jgi:Flp pilus assembly protein TadG
MRNPRTSNRRGNAVLEAALVLPILLALAFGTVEFGHYFYIKHNLQGAASAGVRAALPTGAKNSDVTAAVSEVLTASGLQSSGYTVSTSPSDVSSAAAGAKITVTVSCSWGTVGVRPLGVIPSSKNVTAAAVMRRE